VVPLGPKTPLGAYYRSIARKTGSAVAVFATARKLVVLVLGYAQIKRVYFNRRLILG
jgi:hypothetical protein